MRLANVQKHKNHTPKEFASFKIKEKIRHNVIYMLSTKYSNIKLDDTGKRKNNDQSFDTIIISSWAIEYN